MLGRTCAALSVGCSADTAIHLTSANQLRKRCWSRPNSSELHLRVIRREVRRLSIDPLGVESGVCGDYRRVNAITASATGPGCFQGLEVAGVGDVDDGHTLAELLFQEMPVLDRRGLVVQPLHDQVGDVAGWCPPVLCGGGPGGGHLGGGSGWRARVLEPLPHR